MQLTSNHNLFKRLYLPSGALLLCHTFYKYYNKVLPLLLLILKSFILFSQPTIVQTYCFGTTADDYFTDAIITNDQNLLALTFYGGSDGDATDFDTLSYPSILMKFDTSLNLIWQVGFGGSDGFTTLEDIIEFNSEYLLAGISTATNGTFSGNNGGQDIVILKVDSNGSVIWGESIGSSGLDTYTSILATSDGGAIITGSSAFEDGDIPNHNGSSTSRDVIVVKLNSLGLIEWVHNYGGSDDEIPLGDPVEIEPNKYVIQAQSQSSNFDLIGLGLVGETKRWLFELNNYGDIINANVISSLNDLTTQDGEIFINDNHTITIVGCGYASSLLFPSPEGHSGFEGAVGYINDSLELTNMSQFGGTGTDFLSTHTEDENKNNYFIGLSSSLDFDLPDNYNNGSASDYWLMKTDSNLNLVWSMNFGGSTMDGELGGSNFYGGLVKLNSSLFFFGKCPVPDTLPNYDITCGHQLGIPFIWTTDAWIVKFKLESSPIVTNPISNLFSVFPNPTSGQISIRYSGNHFPALLEIYNTIGQKVYSTEIASMLTELNTSNFKSGPYFFTFILNGEIISSSLIYVNHEKN